MHTLIVSDLHLTDAQEVLPAKPLWKRYKQRDLFIDGSFSRFLAHMAARVPRGAELILAGDIFDFDSVMALPEVDVLRTSWVERRRGLDAEEPKSQFKIRRILSDHPQVVAALRGWMDAGHSVVLIIGNHDIELHWPGVQRDLRLALGSPDPQAMRICAWFYRSGGDTLVEHGNQFDSYCLCNNPLHPTIRWRGSERVRVPFGNLAERYMLNAMGLFNPHVDSSFIMSVGEYVRFFTRYVARIQPLLLWTWFWGAVVTLVLSLREGFLPAVVDPLQVERRLDQVADAAQVSPGVALGLDALSVHPAVFSPWRIVRELWLDRAVIFALLLVVSFQVVTVLNLFSRTSLWWAGGVALLLLPPFVFYARSVHSDMDQTRAAIRERVSLAARIAGVHRVVLGHTHKAEHISVGGVELINTGTWSPAYRDVECTIPFGRKLFAWLRPSGGGLEPQREAALFEWRDPGVVPLDAAALAAGPESQ